MLKCSIHLICIILLFSACDLSKKESLRSQVIDLQLKSVASNNLDSTLLLLKEAKHLLSSASDYDSLKSENNYLLGKVFAKMNVQDSARIYLFNATTHVKDKIKYDRQADYFYDAFDSYMSRGDYGECLALSQRFLSLIDQDSQLGHLQRVLYFEDGVFRAKRDWKSALENSKKRIRVLKKLQDTILEVNAFMSLAYSNFKLGNKEEGAKIYDSLLGQPESLNNDHQRQIYGNYGIFKFYESDYRASRKYYQRGIQFTKREENSEYRLQNLGVAYTNLSEVNIMLKDTLQARQYLDSVQNIGLENVRDYTRKSYFNYRGQLAFAKARDYKGVKSHIDNYVGYLDDTYEEKYTADLESLKVANENEKRIIAENQRIELENIQNENRILFISLFTILLAAIAFVVFRQRKLKFEQKSLQMQQRLLRSQMNPHFTFNTLYAIQSKIKESPEQASNYLLKFSRLLRLILENSMNNNVALENELESLKKYIELQLLRFPKKFTYHIELNDLEDTDLIFIPPMLIQPFVENSIEHGFKGIDYPGHIDIVLSEEGSFVKCEVLDNGTGIQEQNNSLKKSASVQLISDFIKKSTKTNLSITPNDSEGSTTGTKVTFLIPYKLTEHD